MLTGAIGTLTYMSEASRRYTTIWPERGRSQVQILSAGCEGFSLLLAVAPGARLRLEQQHGLPFPRGGRSHVLNATICFFAFSLRFAIFLLIPVIAPVVSCPAQGRMGR